MGQPMQRYARALTHMCISVSPGPIGGTSDLRHSHTRAHTHTTHVEAGQQVFLNIDLCRTETAFAAACGAAAPHVLGHILGGAGTR